MVSPLSEWTQEDEDALYADLLTFQEGWKAARAEVEARDNTKGEG